MRVELINAKRLYNDKTILDIDSLVLERGKIYAVLGPNGSGKTTLLRIMAGIDRASSGYIYYNSVKKPQVNDIAYMPQNTYMFDMTVLENVELGIKNSRIAGGDAGNLAKHALSCVGMGDFSNVKARSLSGGEAQRAALARTLVLGKSLILLDEPASATDISGAELVEGYIKTLNENNGSTVVFTTHNPSQAARIADEVIMMYCGRVIEKGSAKSVFNSPQKQETKDFLKSWRL